MRITWMFSTVKRARLLAALAAGAALFGVSPAFCEVDRDFSNPGVAMSGEAVIASGTCIARYAAILDDHQQPAAAIGRRVAKRCAREISRSAGLASWMTGKPEDFAKNLKYAREDLTTGAVVRTRAAAKR